MSKKELFITAIKTAIIDGALKDALTVNRRKSGINTDNDAIELCDSEGRVLCEVPINRIDQFLDEPTEEDLQWDWGEDVLGAWDQSQRKEWRDEVSGEWGEKPIEGKHAPKPHVKNPSILQGLFNIINGFLGICLSLALIVLFRFVPRGLKNVAFERPPLEELPVFCNPRTGQNEHIWNNPWTGMPEYFPAQEN